MSVPPLHRALLVATAALAFAGCGDSTPPARPTVSSATVRDVYGLGDGSCWRYRYDQGSAFLYANVTTSGPNTTAISGRTVYVRKLSLDSGGLPTEDYFDTESSQEVRLLRHVEGQGTNRVSKRYENDPTPPLFARFIYDAADKAALQVGVSWTTTPTPADLPAERHVWTVINHSEMVTTPDGMKKAYKLLYQRGDSSTAYYYLVPQFGMAKFTDFDGTEYQVCAARVCDSTGACTGAASCDQLTCN